MHAVIGVAICRRLCANTRPGHGAAQAKRQKAKTRSASGDAGIPVKGALRNIPAFDRLLTPGYYNRASGGIRPFQTGLLPKSAVDRRLSRLSLRFHCFQVIYSRGRSSLIFRSETYISRQLSIYSKAKVDNSIFSLLHQGFCLPPYSPLSSQHFSLSRSSGHCISLLLQIFLIRLFLAYN